MQLIMNNLIEEIKEIVKYKKSKNDYFDNDIINYILINVEYIEKQKNNDNDNKIQELCESFNIEIEDEKSIKYKTSDKSILCKIKVEDYYGVMHSWIQYKSNGLSLVPHNNYDVTYYLYIDKNKRNYLYENYKESKLIYGK